MIFCLPFIAINCIVLCARLPVTFEAWKFLMLSKLGTVLYLGSNGKAHWNVLHVHMLF
jgi:hypothetical protein